MSRPDESPAPNFEDFLGDLQQIVQQLETGALGLEQSLAEFERGVKLLRTCYGILEQAEQKIELLVGIDAQGEPSTVPFDATATYDAATYDAKEQAVGRRRSVKKSAAKPPAAPPSADASSDEGKLF